MSCTKLKELNISDSNMGTANVLAALRVLKLSANKELKHFSCNYNDVESRKAATECLEVLISLEGINSVDFIGNVQSKKFNKEWIAKFAEAEKSLKVFEEEDEEGDEDEDEEEEEEEEEEGEYEPELTKLSEKLA